MTRRAFDTSESQRRTSPRSRGPVQVVANLAADTQVVPVPDGYDDLLVSWGPGPERVPGGLRLAGHDVAVVRRRP